jgi:hypothetical protein
VSQIPNADTSIINGTIEMDTHADTCVLGSNFILLSRTGRICDVYPYSDAYDAIKDIPIVTGATATQDEQTGEVFILVIHEGLWYGDRLSHSLINPNQLRFNGIEVQDNPFDSKRMKIHDPSTDVSVPLYSSGTTIFANTRTPSHYELNTCTHVILTSDSPWEPTSVQLSTVRLSAHATEMDPNRDLNERLIAYEMASQNGIIDTDSRILASISTVLNWNSFETEYRACAQTDVKDPHLMISSKRHWDKSPEEISNLWHIGVKQAKETMQATTQKFVRSALLPISRRYRSDRHFYRKHLNSHFSSDLYYGRTQSLHGNTCAYIFSHKSGFVQAYPQSSKTETAESLRKFTRDWGIPRKLTYDGAPEQIGQFTDFQKRIRLYDIDFHVSSPRRPNENPAEGVIREVRKKWFRIMQAKGVPKRLWDYGIVWICEIRQRTTNSSIYSNGRTPIEVITGETPDISEYLDFGFYDFVFYKSEAGLGEVQLGRWLGVSHRVGQLMSYWILTPTCRVVSRTTVQRVTNLERQQDNIIARCKAFDELITEQLKDEKHVIAFDGQHKYLEPIPEELETDQDYIHEMSKAINDDSIPHEEDRENTADAYDSYLNMKLNLPRGDEDDMKQGRVTKRLKDKDGQPIGMAHKNPLFDTRMYEVEWLDGHKEQLSANVIAENLFAQVDSEGNQFSLFDDIIDHRKTEEAVRHEDAFHNTKSGMKVRMPTTKGWEICIQWKDGSTNWIELKDVKNSYPVQLAEYAVGNKIQDEPAFAWWIPKVIKKRHRILSATKSKYWLRTHKYGIEVPKSVDDAKRIDTKNGNTVWWDAIMKEMKNVRIAFEKFKGNERELPPGYQQIKCHMIFDVKLGENFRRKARYVAGGHMTKPPASITYSSVVSRESVRIMLLIAALNDIEILSADIQNAYLHAPCRERIWVRAGPEFRFP